MSDADFDLVVVGLIAWACGLFMGLYTGMGFL